jgi:hypothetical protein
MNKKFKKSDINKYLKGKKLNEERIDELIDSNGSLINKNNNYVQNRNYIKSKKTTDDFVKSATQGPEAYFIYGGPYYGINYSYVVNEEDDPLLDNVEDPLEGSLEKYPLFDEEDEFYDELNVVPTRNRRNPKDMKRLEAKKLAKSELSKFYDEMESSMEDFEIYEGEEKFKSLVDEIIRNKKNDVGMVKRRNEQDLMIDKDNIPDISELKNTYQKPMVVRKLNILVDMVKKENLKGEELAILLNHLLDNVDIYTMTDEDKELIGDKIKYGGQEEQ